MKNICLCNDSFPPYLDGVANVVCNYAKILNEIGTNAFVVTPKFPDSDDTKFNYKVLRTSTLSGNKVMKLGYTVGNPLDVKTMNEVISLNPSVLHCHCLGTTFLNAIEIKKKTNTPIIMTYHTKYDIAIQDSVSNKMVQDGIIKFLVYHLNKHCDELWAVSDGAGKNIQNLGYEHDYIVIKNGVDLPKKVASDDLINEVTGKYNLPHNIPVFLFMGRLYWYKGIRIILDSMSNLKKLGKDFRMVFVGIGKDEDEIKAYTTSLNLDDKIIFTGPEYDRDRVSAWYSRCDLLLLPSTFDTNGLVVREASACNLATVLIKDSCASEGVVDSKDGFLIDENAESLTQKLLSVMDNKELLKKVGQKASDDLYFSWEDAVKIANERYDYVIEKYGKK